MKMKPNLVVVSYVILLVATSGDHYSSMNRMRPPGALYVQPFAFCKGLNVERKKDRQRDCESRSRNQMWKWAESLFKHQLIQCDRTSVDELQTRFNTRGRSIFEKRIEDVYWNSATSCHRPEECSNSSSRSWIEMAGRQAKQACELTFEYDRWGCRVGKSIFNKVSRESAALYALLSSSLAHVAATTLARKGSTQKRLTHGYPKEGHVSSTFLQQSIQQTGKYLRAKMKAANDDVQLQARRHNAVLGLRVLKECVVKSCKCHGFSGSCSMKTCWDTLPGFSIIAHRVRMKYLTAEKIKHSNRPRRALDRLEDSISVLDDSDDFCTNVTGRRCRNPAHCRRFCCDREFYNGTETRYFYCDCHWAPRYELYCKICIKKSSNYYCS